MNYWLFKSEPDEYSIDDLFAEADGSGRWDGIRNYQARNLLRDAVSEGDQVLFYHSSCKVPGVAGTARVVRAAYPDPAQFDTHSPYHDPKSTAEAPRWFCVDIAPLARFDEVLPLARLKQEPALEDMVLLRQGRLSVQPVTAAQWRAVTRLAQA
ncbi:EVE domain-containing protein [Mangrovimicrobium sediminis]|uniref:EVE domain-containing protein n=1 Tax=Mangrovimicrobium sediminis TaxID=2562682 RepID=A0A4Z0LXX4_9GAMM|nr:EVE domain-containing protein [Haliea sp. SAOS-164]TGD72129.1 EVE domain-containing protein [Haliea sp. SAOS-164]